jgi:hypothetical protein
MIGHRAMMIVAIIMMVTLIVPPIIVGKPDIRAFIIIGAVVARIIGIISSSHCATGQQQRDKRQ